MNKEDFLKIKEAYKSARTEEKKRIKDFLLSKRDSEGNLIFLKEKDATDTFVRTGGGYGKKYHSSGGILRFHMIYQIICGLICLIKEMTS